MSPATAILPKSVDAAYLPSATARPYLRFLRSVQREVAIVMTNSGRVFTPAARRGQAERGATEAHQRRIAEGFPDHVTPELAAFIAEQDTAFLATATADGAPYVQHRGGPKGFIKVVDDKTLGFADYRGNRQYLTLANLSENDHAFLFLLDPARRQRIKFWGRARVIENDDALIERLFDKGYKARPERVILFTIEAWDVNCSSHIVARFSEADIEQAFSAVQAKIAELRAENARLRAALSAATEEKMVGGARQTLTSIP